MKISPRLVSTLAAVGHLSEHTFLVPVAAKSRPSGGSRPSGSRPSGFSSPNNRPTTPSFSSPNSRPTTPSFSSPNGRPSASTPTFNRPTLGSRPSVKTPSGPISSTTRSPYNPSPQYKPLNTAGAPTVRSGGGGYRSTAKRVVAGVVAGAVAYAAVSVAAGYFLYGGRHSSPYCRGSDQDRFLTGRCPRGTSSQNHGCTSDIPLCPIPAVVKSRWALGSTAPPQVDVLFDKSVCSVIDLPAVEGAAGNATATATATVATEAPASEAPPTSATEAETDSTDSDSTRRLAVEGESGLDACFRRILAAGGCSDHNPASMFQYDDASGACGCCSGVQVTTLAADDFASAVYAYRTSAIKSAPDHCISGSTLFYPDANGGPDVQHACECGACARCGGGAPRYMDWSGPFVVPDDVGDVSFADQAKTVPLYDPVDTCICDDFTASQCELNANSLPSSAASRFGWGGFSSNLVVATSTLFMFFGFIRRA